MEAQCAGYRSKLNPAPFATIVPSRRPEVKYHAGMGRAKSAVSYAVWGGARGGEIYERTADGWALLYRVESGTPTDELPWKRGEPHTAGGTTVPEHVGVTPPSVADVESALRDLIADLDYDLHKYTERDETTGADHYPAMAKAFHAAITTGGADGESGEG